MRSLPIWAFLALIFLSCEARAQEAWRTALVIANGDYRNHGALDNPVRDGELVGRALEEVGFDRVLVKRNLTRVQIDQILEEFARESENAAVSLIYFAGHGIGTREGNFLLPVDADLTVARDVGAEAVSADEMLRATVGARVRIVVLDACRDFPLGGATEIRRGLVAREIDDVVLMYSAADGETASDGERGKNSPFAAVFAQSLLGNSIDVRRFAGLVRENTMAFTRGRQRPYFTANLGSGEYVLTPPFDDPSRYGDRLAAAVMAARSARDRADIAAASAEEQLAQARASAPDWVDSTRMVALGRYRGELADELPHGLGDLEFRDMTRAGETYIGEFVEGEIEGLGIWIGRKPAVQGWLRYRYAGEHHRGMRDGDGIISIAQPPGLAFDRYMGEVREDFPNGFGVMRFADGRRYDGQWRDGAPHGYGMGRTAEGQWQIGRWSDGELVEDLRSGN